MGIFSVWSLSDDTKEKRFRSTDQTALRTDDAAQCASSASIEKSKWEKVKEFCADESNFSFARGMISDRIRSGKYNK